MVRLGVGHIDVIQCYDVEFVSLEQVAGEAIPALRALQGTWLVQWVVVTGYPLPALLHAARQVPVDTVMSYCHYTVQDRRLAAGAASVAASGVALINASPLAMGALTDRGAPPCHPATAQVLNRCAKAAARCRERGSSLARLALQFSVMTSPCVTTVVGSASPANVKRDVEWIGEQIDADLLAEVEAILEPVRDIGWISGRAENQDPGRAS